MSQLAFSANVVALPLFRGTNSLHSPRLSCKQSPFITSYRAVAKRRRTRLHQALPRRVIVSSDASEAPTETESSNAEPRPRNSTSWFEFRNLRIVLAILSLLGAAETTYLTFNKFFSSPGAICATQGCLDVLSGPFSSFLGIPLTLFGALAYGAFAYMAVWPLAADEEETEDGTLRTVEEVYAARDATTRPLLLALSTALFLFSGYLMALLVFVIQSMCPYCVFSAIVSTALFTLTAFVGRAVPNVVDALRVGAVASGVTSAAAAVLFFIGYPAHIRAQPSGEPQAPPAITMRSTSDTLVRSSQLSLLYTSVQ